MEETSRLPEGMEWLIEAWPKFEDDAPVKLGDMALIDGYADMVEAVQIWIHGKPVIYGDNGSQQLEKGERVKRPEILAADGKPLEVGQTVWHTKTGAEYRVLSLPDGEKGAWLEDSSGKHLLDHAVLTHQRPVLDADGARIDLGDDLYSVEGGLKFHVSNIDKANCRIATSAMFALDKWADPSMFTHTKPEHSDSWEKWREDFIKPPCVYCRDILGVEFDHDTELDKAFDAQVQDMERRCKALAERGER